MFLFKMPSLISCNGYVFQYLFTELTSLLLIQLTRKKSFFLTDYLIIDRA